MTLIGNLTFWAGKLLILIIFLMIWWSLWSWDVLVATFVTIAMILGAYVGLRKAMKEIHGEDYIDPIERRVTEYLSSSKKEEIPIQDLENNVPKKVEKKQEKSKNVLYIAILLAIIGIILAFFMGMYLGGTSSSASLTPSSISAPTFVQPLTTTQLQPQDENKLPQSSSTSTVTHSQSCSNIGKWTETEYQGSPVSGVYLLISPNNTIELFLNGQLHNHGTWKWISNNKFQVDWMGQTGQSAPGKDTVTISSDCNTQTYNSQRGERSVFVKM